LPGSIEHRGCARACTRRMTVASNQKDGNAWPPKLRAAIVFLVHVPFPAKSMKLGRKNAVEVRED
jgi:hypothetical protein